MSLEVLNQVYDEVRRLAIAGSSVAPGDFRLKKLIPALEQAGKKSPVFAKLAEATSTLVESSDKTASVALLDLGTLINSILYTQGETSVAGELEPIDTKDFGLSRTQTSARLLKPLLEALTTTGSGRMEIIRDAKQRGLFNDLRLIRPALFALDDVYGEIAEFIASEVLPIYGLAILPELESQFDPKGKPSQSRRLALMHKLNPVAARPHVQAALDEGSKELRVAAIGCLGTSPEDLPFLMEQSKAKAKDVRAAALMGLSRLPVSAASQALVKTIDGSDLEIAVEPLRASRTPEVLAALVLATNLQLEVLLATKEKDKAKAGKEVTRLLLLLRCLAGRNDSASEQTLLAVFEHHEFWQSVKSTPGGIDLLEELSAVLASGTQKMQKSLVSTHAKLPIGCLQSAFTAAWVSCKPDELFATFSPYLTASTDAKKKGKDPNASKSELIINMIAHDWYQTRAAGLGRWSGDEHQVLLKTLSPKWKQLAIDRKIGPLILRLATDDKASYAALSTLFEDSIVKSKEAMETSNIIEVMTRVQHPDTVDVFCRTIEKHAKATAWHGTYWLMRLVPKLPKDEAIRKLEALLPKLPEKMAEALIHQIVELKQQ